ncbi:n-alkane-inducible cytochrome p450 [Seiridium cupressi]
MMALGGIMREEEHFQIFASRIPTDEGEVDIQALLISLVTDELGKFAVGEPIGALDKNQEPEAKQLDEGYQFVKEKISRLAQSGAASWLYDRSQFRRASSIIRHYTERFVTEALETRRGAIREGRDALPQRRTFVQRAVDEGYSFADVRDQTTTMRIMPSVPFNAKVANSDIWLPKGGGRDGHSSILIEKGQIVVFWAWAFHRNRETFGEDANEFRPERWKSMKRDILQITSLSSQVQGFVITFWRLTTFSFG